MELPAPFGPYLLLSSLGSGAMGDAHLARPRDRKSGMPTPVVVKRLHAALSEDERFVRRFRHEATIATQIDSPYVAKVFDAGQVGDTLYIAMEYIPGWPLARVIAQLSERGAEASLASAIDLVAGVLEGLDALHEAKDATGQPLAFVHRDISPRNVIVGEDGRARVIDLGIGKSRLQDWQTKTGAILGSPGYMAPEQVLAEKVDCRSDLYAVGLLLFELLTLEPFIGGSGLQAKLRASMAPPFRSPRARRPELPDAIDRVLSKLLAHAPEQRFQSARELITALRAITPERGGAAMESLLGRMLFDELGETRAEIHRLIISEPIVSDLETVKTEVYVRRAGFEATLDSPTRPIALQDRPAPTVISSGRTPTAQRRPARRVLLTGLIMAAFAGTLALGISLGRVTQPPPAPRDAPRAPPAPVSAMPRAPESAAPEPAAPEPAAPEPAAPGHTKSKEPRPHPAPALASAPVLVPGAPLDPQARLDALIKRTTSLRRSSDTATRVSLDNLLARLNRERSSGAFLKEPARLDALAAEVERLASEAR